MQEASQSCSSSPPPLPPPSSSGTVSASTESKDPNPCPVCLEPIKDEAYLDRCFHTFCYKCIAHWTKIITRKHSQPLLSIQCPLCKSENFSIVHGLSGNYFRRHYVNQDPENSFLSRAHMFRWQCYASEPGMLGQKFNVASYWKYRRYLKQNMWLENWLRRDIQTLTEEEDVDIIVHHILGVIESFLKRQKQQNFSCTLEQKREEFKALLSDAARPFVHGRTERFFKELEMFLVSGLNIEAYDEIYMQYMSMPTSHATSHYTETGQSASQVPVLDFLEEPGGSD